MDPKIVEAVSKDQVKNRPDVKVGDTVRLSLTISEGDKERTQIFEGIVLSLKGTGLNQTMTVRKISYGIGVERIIPVHSPKLEKVEIVKRGTVRRSKLYYMRDRVGKLAMKIKNSTPVMIGVEEPVQEVEVEVTPETEVKETKEVEVKEENKKEEA